MGKNKNRNRKGNKKGNKGKNNDNVEKIVGQAIRGLLATGLRAGGSYVGNTIAPGIGGEYGRSAGATVSRILGFGDYTVTRNTLKGAPMFGKGSRNIRIRHREFIGDMLSSTTFDNNSFYINPGNQTLFPWLSGIAQSYQQYKIHGMVFCFNTTSATALNSTNTALGTVMMATNYDVTEEAYVSKAELMSSYFSTSGKPSESLMHAIECNPKERPVDVLFIDHGGEAVGDRPMFDHGRFQFATAGMQATATIGELWVSYDIELMKPRKHGGTSVGFVHNGAWTTTDGLGTVQTDYVGQPVSIISDGTGYNRVDLTHYIGKSFEINAQWTGDTLSGGAVSTTPGSALSANAIYNLGTTASINPGGTTVGFSRTLCYSIPASADPDDCYLDYTVSLTSGTPEYVDINIVTIPAELLV
jgi:hypothetical protein